MRSMTGFGVGSAPLGDGRLSLEVRALNHRHQDVRVRMPADLAEQAFFVEQLARARLGRGRYDIAVRVEGRFAGAPRVNTERLRGLHAALRELSNEISPGSEVPLTALLGLPHVFESDGVDSDAVRQALEEAFTAAANGLGEMRLEEGHALQAELAARLASARQLRSQIEAGAEELVLHQRKRLRERLEKLLTGVEVTIEPTRLEAELAILADKSDITEELVRLGSHFGQLEALFSSSESIGRRLDFLLQEVGREVNTIGSKCLHATVSHLVVEMKAEIERMREQVQNVD
jgi:uncharacterized protein (TIGR00255 family)